MGWSSLLLLAFGVLNTCARVCDIQDPQDTFTHSTLISSQAQFDANFTGCTTLNGSIIIGSNYTGPFRLPGVTSITGSIYQQDSRYDQTSIPKITSIEAPDLTSLVELDIGNGTTLTTVSFPKLSTTMSSLSLRGMWTSTLNFASLPAISRSLQLDGCISSMNFESLTTINGSLLTSDYNLDGSHRGLPRPGFDINFPNLQYAGECRFENNISSISAPRLATIQIPEDSNQYFYSSGLYIATFGNPLNFSLPSLSNVSQIELIGIFSGISFPSLVTTDTIQIANTKSSLDLDTGPLQTVNDLDIEGKITAVSLPSITSVNTLKIVPDNRIDCTDAAAVWARSKHPEVGTYECFVAPVSPESINHQQMVTGLSAGLPVFAVVVIALALWRWWVRRQKAKPKLPQYEMEVLPKYSVDGASERPLEPAAPAATHLPDERSPAYEDVVEGRS